MELDTENLKPVYALCGEERLLVSETLETLKKAALKGSIADFNLDVLSLKDSNVNARRVVEAAQTLPAFAKYRVVIVKDADKLSADDTDLLSEYLQNASPSTVLIVVADKFDARTKFYKALQKAGAILRFDHPKEREMPAILKRRAKAMGVVLEDDAVRALVQALGADLGSAVQALEKLHLYVGLSPNARITALDVETCVSYAKEESIFDFSDAVGSRNLPTALVLLNGLLSHTKGHPLGLLGMIARHWRNLTTVRSLLDAGAPRQDLQVALGLPPFVVDKLIAQARKQSMPSLIRGLRAISEADQEFKGGKLNADRVMERLVLTLANSPDNMLVLH